MTLFMKTRDSIPRSKLMAPSGAAQHIQRTSIVDHICAPAAPKLTLVRAPAGFGKSTLMLQCQARLREMSVATAWLTLDRSDNDASRLLLGLEAATVSIVNDDDIGRYSENDPTVGGMASQITSRLSGYNAPFALFLDDMETLQEPGVLGLLREIIDYLPPKGRFIIGSRNLPDLHLGRMRARGHLLEIDPARLRFTLKETSEYFTTRRNVDLAEEHLSLLQNKTEGWVAAIWLASVALERNKNPSEFVARLSGAERSIAHYLAEEILAHQPPHIRQFLLRTSVLRQLEPALCSALMPGADSGRILHELETADVMLTPVGSSGDGYRYHSLFADFLKSELARELPNELAHLHSAASAWYETQDRPIPAIDHALEGGNISDAVRLMSIHCAGLVAQGRMRLLTRWFSVLPTEVLKQHPELQLIHMWAVCFTHGAYQAMDLLAQSGLKTSTAPEIMAHVRALEPCLLAIMDRYEEAHDIGLKNLELRSGVVPFADDVLSNATAHITSVIGNHVRARQLIDRVRRSQADHASEFNRMYSEASDGFIDLQEAKLRQATARFRIAVTATYGSYVPTNGNAWAGVPYAVALYDSGQIDQAAHLLQVYAPLARDVGLPDLVILSYVTLSRIAFLRGDIDQVLHFLTELEYLGHKNRLRRVVCSARLERSRVFLLQGHREAAREELDRAEDDEVWERVGRLRYLANDLDYLALGRMRLQLHAGALDEAALQLAAAAKHARSESRYRRALKLELMYGAALFSAGDTASGSVALANALRAASPEGFIRLVLDEGDIMRAPIHALTATLQSGVLPRDEAVFVSYVQRLAQALGPVTPASAPSDKVQSAILLEPLTRKEMHVLQLLAEGYSNSAMAEKLFVSDSTIRTHLRNINTKLDAQNRTHAVATARRLNIIS